MHRRFSLPLAVLAFIVSAFANALTFPPWGLRPLAFVSLVPLLLALRSAGMARAVGIAAIWCLLYAWLIASVFPESLAGFYDRPLWFGVVAALLIFFFMASIYYAAFAAADQVLIRRPHAYTPLLVAAAWVVAELGRGRLFTGTPFFIGNPWGLVGYSHASGPLAQIAEFTGVYGIAFTIVAVNAGIAGLIGAWPVQEHRRVALRGLGLSLLPVMISAIYGAAVLARAPDPDSIDGLDEIAVVQGNVSIERRWRSDFHAKNLRIYLELTHAALRSGSPRLVIWPETAMNFFVETDPRYRETILAGLGTSGAELLAGGPSAESDRRTTFHNSVFLMDAERGVSQRYDKEYLVPFSEYVPSLSFDWMKREIEGARHFAPGPAHPEPLETSIGRVGLLICNEAMLPEIAADRVREGAEILVSPSNDSWIRGRAFAEHMLAIVALRSIEHRRYLVRASTAGPSAVVDPWGRVTARSPIAEPAMMRGRVRPEIEITLYARIGDAFSILCLILVAGAIARPWLRPE